MNVQSTPLPFTSQSVRTWTNLRFIFYLKGEIILRVQIVQKVDQGSRLIIGGYSQGWQKSGVFY